MEVVTLSGEWRIRQVGTESEWLPATVPGCVHTALMAAGRLPDPFYRDNEKAVLWVGEADWEYHRTFQAAPALLAHDRLLLRFDGLDTLATIWLNGVELAQTDNMFRCWQFDVSGMLNPGENELRIQFTSALRVGQARLAERTLHNWGTDAEKLPGGNYIRKAQSHFGWDWGPKLVTCGIWRDVSLIAVNEARLADLHVRQAHLASGAVELRCAISVDQWSDESLQVIMSVKLGAGTAAIRSRVVNQNNATITVSLPNPKLWWPNGMGEQTLYTVVVSLLDPAGQLLDQQQRRIGLRTLRLVREKDEWGESFHFACNGVPFFAKGANWIPADSFLTRLTRADYTRLLRAAADANMNMLRVWGGGIYEPGIFYDLCDELGICVWQDFMFACATYPTDDDAFMANVTGEAVDNIRRLRHHASLALWCGNNELEQGLVHDTWTDQAMSWADYGKLFDDLLPTLVAELDPETDYWPSSPHTPYEDRRAWNDPRWGDAHIWDVWHGMEPFEFYDTCFHRFNSEFGFQSFPEPMTVRRYAEPEDANITSYVMEHHQRSPGGNSKIMQYMLDWFRLPTTFEKSLWLSQILQGVAVKRAVEHWRRTMPRGMGTLYWQLNDCWPVASWSSLDYFGRWKALHHMARAFYAPLLVSAVADIESETVAVHVTSDLLTETAASLHWQAMTVDGAPVAGGKQEVVISPNQSMLVETLDLKDALAEYGARDLLVWVKLAVDREIVSENLALFARPKHLNLLPPSISWDVDSVGGDRYRLTLTATRPALWVWLEGNDPSLNVGENFFHLRPHEPRTVKVVTVGAPWNVAQVKAALKVMSLFDTYQPGGIPAGTGA